MEPRRWAHLQLGDDEAVERPERRAERQRKYRTLTDYGRNEMEFEAPPASITNGVRDFEAMGRSVRTALPK